MQLSKIKSYYLRKIIFLKIFLIAFYILLIFISNIFNNFGIAPIYNSIYKRFIADNFFREDNMNCDKFDPIYLMGERFENR